MFIDKALNIENQNELSSKFNNHLVVIRNEEAKIFNLIEKYSSQFSSKNKLISYLATKSTFSKNSINNLLISKEFNSKYNTNYSHTEIKSIKKLLLVGKTEEQIIDIVTQDDLFLILEKEKIRIKSLSSNLTLSFDSEGTEVFNEAKILAENIMGDKFKSNSEFIYYCMLDFLSNNY